VINIGKILITLSFGNQELLREMNLDVILVFLSFGILVLDVEDAQHTIVTRGEEDLIIE
jgi:hypothetical protein